MSKKTRKVKAKARQTLLVYGNQLERERKERIENMRFSRGATKVSANAKGHRLSALKGQWV